MKKEKRGGRRGSIVNLTARIWADDLEDGPRKITSEGILRIIFWIIIFSGHLAFGVWLFSVGFSSRIGKERILGWKFLGDLFARVGVQQESVSGEWWVVSGEWWMVNGRKERLGRFGSFDLVWFAVRPMEEDS
jgi:hypothetical protein